MAAGNQRKHLEYNLALSTKFFSLLNLKNIRVLFLTYSLFSTRKQKGEWIFRVRDMFLRSNLDVTRSKKIDFQTALFSKQSMLPS